MAQTLEGAIDKFQCFEAILFVANSKVFYYVNYVLPIIMSKVRQIISVMKTLREMILQK